MILRTPGPWAAAVLASVALVSPVHAQVTQVPARPAPPVAATSKPVAEAAGNPSGPEIRAQLSPRRFTTIAAEIGARVQRISAPEGAAFRAGQPLVSFDCSVQQAQLARAKVALDVASKQLATQARLAELNAIGKQEVEQAEGEVAKQKAEIAQIQVMLTKCSVSAAFSGRVAEQKVREQQYVQPGQPLLEIIDDSVLEVEFIMPSRWLSSVHVGSIVQFAVDETGRTYPAKVIRLGARVDPVSQSVKVVAAIEGRPRELIAGMSGRLLVNRQQ